MPSKPNSLDAVGETPTASTVSGIFEAENLASKTIDASKRLAGLEPAHNQLSASALFECVHLQGAVQKFKRTPTSEATKIHASLHTIFAGALFQTQKGHRQFRG